MENIKDLKSIITSEATDNEIVIKGVNCEIFGLPAASQIEFILCDVRINDGDDTEDIVSQLQKELDNRTEQLNSLLNQAAADRIEIENIEKKLSTRRKKVSELEEELTVQRENKIILDTRINERITLFNNLPGSIRDSLYDSYSSEISSLKEKRASVKKVIENLNSLLANERKVRDVIDTEVLEKRAKLIDKLLSNNK